MMRRISITFFFIWIDQQDIRGLAEDSAVIRQDAYYICIYYDGSMGSFKASLPLFQNHYEPMHCNLFLTIIQTLELFM